MRDVISVVVIGVMLMALLGRVPVVAQSKSAASEDAPGTWVLFVSPPGTGNDDKLPPYSKWKEVQTYQGLAKCQAAQYSFHMKYWDSDRDLSMRMLRAVCYNPDTREARGQQ